ncbi:MAG TPA: hypothetical protein VGH74_22545 [Planctomycetaceae bacterium]
MGDRESEIPESERAYSAQLQQRAKLNDDEFYEAFYAETGIPKHIPIRLRTLLQKNIMGDDLSALHPNDNLALIYDGLDFADVLYRVGKEFELTIPLTVCKSKLHADGEIDGTFDSVVRYLNRATIKKTRKD